MSENTAGLQQEYLVAETFRNQKVVNGSPMKFCRCRVRGWLLILLLTGGAAQHLRGADRQSRWSRAPGTKSQRNVRGDRRMVCGGRQEIISNRHLLVWGISLAVAVDG